MREADYILATNIAKIRIAIAVVRDITNGGVIPQHDHLQVLRYLSEWEEATNSAIARKNATSPPHGNKG